MEAIKHKNKVYSRYKNADHPAYVKAARLARLGMKTARKNFEVKLARDVKENVKSFYACVRSKSRSRIRVGPVIETHVHALNRKISVSLSTNCTCCVEQLLIHEIYSQKCVVTSIEKYACIGSVVFACTNKSANIMRTVMNKHFTTNGAVQPKTG